MPNERDKLIRLIMKANSPLISPTRAKQLADYLLDNNIIVPPCKIGDTIYKLILFKDRTGFYVEHQVVGFHVGELPKLRGHKRDQYFIVWHKETNSISHLNFEQIGKTVFFTKEEAEKALKGGNDNAE